MAHYVYLLQDSMHISSGLNIYKIGMTTLLPHQRFSKYTKDSIPYAFMVVRDCRIIEDRIVEKFTVKFRNVKDLGREWFEGDIVEMKNCFTEIVLDDYRSEREAKRKFLDNLPSYNQESQSDGDEEIIEKPLVIEKLNIVQGFTKEYIKENMYRLTDDLIKQGIKGVSKFLLDISVYEAARIYICIDTSKNKFSKRLPNGDWEDDPKGHMVNYIFNFVDVERLKLLGKDKNIEDFIKAIDSSTHKTKYIRLVLNEVKFEMESN